MPAPLMKKYAKETNKTVSEIEKIWDEAKSNADKAIGKKGSSYWAYVNGTVRKRLGLKESLTFKEYVELSFDNSHSLTDVSHQQSEENPYGLFISCIFAARDKAHKLHLGTKSYAHHMALNELYVLLAEYGDKMTETWQGKHGITTIGVPASVGVFDQPYANTFIQTFTDWLENKGRLLIGTDSFIINQFEELIGEVFRIKYKLDNLQ